LNSPLTGNARNDIDASTFNVVTIVDEHDRRNFLTDFLRASNRDSVADRASPANLAIVESSIQAASFCLDKVIRGIELAPQFVREINCASRDHQASTSRPRGNPT
jgi:hypothetical protein